MFRPALSTAPSAAIPARHCTVEWAGTEVQLLPDRAIWWPQARTLFVADLHIGKAATYRALGQPVPGGTTRENLGRLDALISAHSAAQLVFLGDFLHAAAARTPGILQALHEWRKRHARVAMTLVRGNHDSRAGDPPASLEITVVDEPFHLGPFACCHHPQEVPGAFVLAGHLHPVCRLFGRGHDSLRMPCYVRRSKLAVLPAFGEFTGGWMVGPDAEQRLYPVGGGSVWCLPEG
jgi:uncharacterized protein